MGTSERPLIGSGHAWPGMEILIVDPETSAKCPPDRIGEIWLRGKNVAQGYWNNPQATRKTFHAYLTDTGEGPFLRTGDLGFLSDGELFVTGRWKDLIIIRGQNHYPQDIESTVARSHPALRPNCGAAFSIEVEHDERLAVVQEISPDRVKNLDEKEVIAAIRKAVSAEHELQPYAVVLVKPTTIPRTSSGKIQRGLCAERFSTDDLNVIARSTAEVNKERQQPDKAELLLKKVLDVKEPVARLPLVELYLLEKIAPIVKIPATQIDTQELIIALGIDSLATVALIGALSEDLNVCLRIEDLEEATITTLAMWINEQLTLKDADQREEDS